MRIVERIMKKNPCFKAGRKIRVKGLMLHSVGCPKPDAEVFVKNWNSPSYGRACVHAFIDGKDGTVYQTLPWDHRGWHCGSGRKGSANDTHIGVEMCEPGSISYTGGTKIRCRDKDAALTVVKQTYGSAVELFAMLCEKYRLDPLGDGVIISHREGQARGIASAHGDPEHLWEQLGTGYTMDGFRRDAKAAMEGKKEKAPGNRNPGIDNADCPFRVRVGTADLNIRKGPGTDEAKTGKKTGVGVFIIVEVRAGKGSAKGWGKMKSGAGWISLDYCEKV